jgi:hypothetical protein
MAYNAWDSISTRARNIRIRSEIFLDIYFFEKFSGKTEAVRSNSGASLVEYSSYFYASWSWSLFYRDQS